MPRLKPFQDDLPLPDVVHPLPSTPGSHHLSIAATGQFNALYCQLDGAVGFMKRTSS
jgi:hypothetical protein